MYNNFSSHVKYWLERGLGVRRRISALGRRFGGTGGIGAWETFRLFQTAYLPTVCYGLEYLTDHGSYVKDIQLHVNDCLRSLFRTPSMLANKILWAEMGVPPIRLRGRYLQRRYHARMINYRYGENHPWYGAIRNDWDEDGQTLLLLHSDAVLPRPPIVRVADTKEAAKRVHDLEYTDWIAPRQKVVHSDGSKDTTGTAAAWVVFTDGAITITDGCVLPPAFSIVECELFAILAAMRALAIMRV